MRADVLACGSNLRMNVKVQLVGKPVLGSYLNDLFRIPSRNVKIVADNSRARAEFAIQLGA